MRVTIDVAKYSFWRGITKHSRGWFLVGCVLTAAQVLHHLLAEPEVRATAQLHAGEAIEVSVVPPPSR